MEEQNLFQIEQDKLWTQFDIGLLSLEQYLVTEIDILKKHQYFKVKVFFWEYPSLTYVYHIKEMVNTSFS